MIKATELKIGNWVNYLGTPTQLLTGKQIDDNHKVVNPIPLTPGILAKFKFDFVDFVLAFCDKNHIIHECGESGEFWWEFHPFCTNDTDCHLELHYVHELQNILFVFSGEDITVNFKDLTYQ